MLSITYRLLLGHPTTLDLESQEQLDEITTSSCLGLRSSRHSYLSSSVESMSSLAGPPYQSSSSYTSRVLPSECPLTLSTTPPIHIPPITTTVTFLICPQPTITGSSQHTKESIVPSPCREGSGSSGLSMSRASGDQSVNSILSLPYEGLPKVIKGRCPIHTAEEVSHEVLQTSLRLGALKDSQSTLGSHSSSPALYPEDIPRQWGIRGDLNPPSYQDALKTMDETSVKKVQQDLDLGI